MPWNVGKNVVGSSDGALEEDHSQRGFEDLLVVGITIQGFAEFGDRRISMSHDVVVDLLGVDALRGLEMQGRNAETAMEVALVGLERWEDDFAPCRAMLVDLENGEDQSQHVVDKVVQQPSVVLVDVDEGLLRGVVCLAVGKVEEVEVQTLFRRAERGRGPVQALVRCPELGRI